MCRACTDTDPDELMPPRMYVITVLQQVGDQLARDNFWNFGLFSHLHQRFKPVPAGTTLAKVLASQHSERWASMMPRLLAVLQPLCARSVHLAYIQVRLAYAVVMLATDELESCRSVCT